MVEQNFRRLTFKELKEDPVFQARSDESIKSILALCGHLNPPTREEMEYYDQKLKNQLAELRAKHPGKAKAYEIPDISIICPEPVGFWINAKSPFKRNRFFDQQIKAKSRGWGRYRNLTRLEFTSQVTHWLRLVKAGYIPSKAQKK